MIALYQGISPISRAIRIKTWSVYSHAAWICEDGDVIEAWMPGGVRKIAWDKRHTPGTRVDVFSLDLTVHQREIIEHFLMKQVGKPYDYAGIAGFVFHRPQDANNQKAWFCSEIIFSACIRADVHLLRRILPCKVSPGHLAISPLLTLADHLWVPTRHAAVEETLMEKAT